MGRLRLTEAEYQLSQNSVVWEGCNAEVDRMSAMVFFEWILRATCLIVQLAIIISLSSLLLHEDDAGSCLSTSLHSKRTSHLVRPHLLLYQNIFPCLQSGTGA